MGIEHVINDLDASELNIGYSPLVPSGLEYLNFFGGSTPIGRNLAPGKPAATVLGAPAAGDMAEGVRFVPGADYLQTSVAHTSTMTMLAIVITEAEGDAMVVSNFSNPAVNTSLRARTQTPGGGQVVANGIVGYTNGGAVSTVSGNIGPVDVGDPIALACRIDLTLLGASPGKIDNLTTDQAASISALPSGATPNIGGAMRIGSGYSPLGSAVPFSALFVAIWSRILSDGELEAQYAQLKEFYQTMKGVAI